MTVEKKRTSKENATYRDTLEESASLPPQETPLGPALFRVMRAVVFANTPLPELDALPLAQLRLLWQVSFSPDSTMTDFSERLGVSQSTVTQLADRLVRRGLIERHADPHDRRVIRLHTSEEGQRLMEKDKQQSHRIINAVWESLTTQERDTVMGGLATLASAGEAIRAAQGRPLEHCAEKRAMDETPSEPVLDLMTRRVRGRAPADR